MTDDIPPGAGTLPLSCAHSRACSAMSRWHNPATRGTARRECPSFCATRMAWSLRPAVRQSKIALSVASAPLPGSLLAFC